MRVTWSGWRSYEDRRLAWSEVAEEGLEVHLIPGNHLSMVDDPYVQVMANKLRLCLERARRAEEAPSTTKPEDSRTVNGT